MASKQGTLNKWFSGQTGSAPAKKADPRQSKLKLQNPSHDSTPACQPNARCRGQTAPTDPAESDDASAMDMADVVPANKIEVVVKDRSTSQSPSCSASQDEDEEDQGPVKKRRRINRAPAKSETVEAPPTEFNSSPRTKASTTASPRVKKEESLDTTVPEISGSSASSSPRPRKKAKADADRSRDATRVKLEAAGESQEENESIKPAAGAKAGANASDKDVASIHVSGKDAYPDWPRGRPVPYAALCTTLHRIEMTTKRLEILAHCSLFLRQVLRLTPDDLLETVLLMTNKLGADYNGVELGIGESLIMKAIAESTGRSLAVIKADQHEMGDLGLVAAKSRSNQSTMFKPKPLTVKDIFRGLTEIALVQGLGSQTRKISGIKKLLSAADSALVGKRLKNIDMTAEKGGSSEAKYIVRTLEGKLRLGLAEKSVLVALAQAVVCHRTEHLAAQASKTAKPPPQHDLDRGESIMKSVYSQLPSYEFIIPALAGVDYEVEKLSDSCKLRPGVPLKPMLAKPTKSITEVLDRFENKQFTCEYKYDGERAQIHFVAHSSSETYATGVSEVGKSEKGVANVFSRNSEDLSKKYPDILAKLPSWIRPGITSFVLDCESVAWDVVEKKVLPFQQLMTRKRKDVKAEEIKVQVCVFAFDLLYLNGEALVGKPLRDRRSLLHQSFAPVQGEFVFATFADGKDLEQIQLLLDESIKASCEGLMVKMLDGPESFYEPSRRSQNWLKVKKDYLAGVGDSLDLVVLGAYYGRGKRTSWYGAFLLACYNPASETYETICNIGTGFSDDTLADLHAKLSVAVISKPKPFYQHSAGNKDQPDVWLEPRFVWEVKTADLTVSPRYRAAASEIASSSSSSVAAAKGISLRFPRFIREREDKKTEDATTSRAIADMYRRQEHVTRTKGPSVDDDFEY